MDDFGTASNSLDAAGVEAGLVDGVDNHFVGQEVSMIEQTAISAGGVGAHFCEDLVPNPTIESGFLAL
jgi:hypothetical protein